MTLLPAPLESAQVTPFPRSWPARSAQGLAGGEQRQTTCGSTCCPARARSRPFPEADSAHLWESQRGPHWTPEAPPEIWFCLLIFGGPGRMADTDCLLPGVFAQSRCSICHIQSVSKLQLPPPQKQESGEFLWHFPSDHRASVLPHVILPAWNTCLLSQGD